MFLALLIGTFTAAALLAVHVLWLGLPPRSLCVECGRPTEPVSLGILRPLQGLLLRRWCPTCGWTGVGRNGPVLWSRKGPVAHGSGFRWNRRDLPQDLGFTFGDEGPEGEGESPAPAGFRWAAPPAPPGSSHGGGGFRWGPDGDQEPTTLHGPPTVGFRWGPDGSTPEVIHARGPSGAVRRLIRVDDATRAVGFRWGDRPRD